jgi:uncharacterized repeat protein (TIGR04052 family)
MWSHARDSIKLCATLLCLSLGCDDAAPKLDAGSTPRHSASDAERAAKIADAAEPAAANDASAAERAVTLRFRASIGDDEFACGKNYAAQGSTHVSITPQDLRMYIAEIDLITRDGERQRVTMDERAPWQSREIALLDFEDGTGNCFGDTGTNRDITGHVPPRDYAAVRFVLGVPDALNHAPPDSLPAPLHEPGMSWNWLLGFRFIKAEVGEVVADDGADASLGHGAFHLGSVACSGNPSAGTVSCAKPNRNDVMLGDFDPDADAIAFDVGVLFSTLDLSGDAQCHSAEAVCEPMLKSLGIDFSTGQPAPEQRAFRVWKR